MAAAVSLAAVRPQRRTSPWERFCVVATSLGVYVLVNLVAGTLHLPSVGGAVLIAVGVLGLLLGLPTLTILRPRSYEVSGPGRSAGAERAGSGAREL